MSTASVATGSNIQLKFTLHGLIECLDPAFRSRF